MNHRKARLGISAVIAVLLAVTAAADAGVPMIAIAWPAAWALLLPIIASEAIVARHMLCLRWSQSFKISAVANALSTLVGIPLTWVIAFAVTAAPAYFAEKVFRQEVTAVIAAPLYVTWLPPLQKSTVWMIPAALAILSVPFLLTSVWLERLVVARMLPMASLQDVRRWAWGANLLSYGVIIAALTVDAIVLYGRTAAQLLPEAVKPAWPAPAAEPPRVAHLARRHAACGRIL
jgi:hypothetical protein